MKTPALSGSSPKVNTTIYNKFRGVDFSTDPSQIDKSRSPWAPNLVSDTGGNPEKRPGWRSLFTVEGTVNGLFSGVVSLGEGAGDEEAYLLHAGTGLYRWTPDGTPELLRENVHNARSAFFGMNGRIWILTGAEYLVYGLFDNPDYVKPAEGETTDVPEKTLQLKDVSEIAYVPTTIIARAPAGGGTILESVNLVGKKRKNKFLTTSEKTYKLDSDKIESVDRVLLNDVEKAEGTDYTVDLDAGKITFKATMPSPPTAGVDNLEVTFSKTVEGYAGRVNRCRIASLYGSGTSDRVFITGNPDYRNQDWYSGLSDPSYFPDLNYSKVGAEGTRIMGYLQLGEYQVIVKEPNEQDSTVFLRSAQVSGTGETLFPLRQGVAGVGAVASGAVKNFRDEPLFLSRTGIQSLATNAITYERTIQNRSYYVDARLTKESELENAVAVEWDGYYLLCVNSRCYVLDGRQNKTYKPQSYGDYVYECYYWENVPAVCFLEKDGALFFGTADGRVCRFNTDRERMERYSDDGAPIVAEWATRADDDGDFVIRKTMLKKGSGVMIKPYTRSSVKVLLRTDEDCVGRLVKESPMDIWDWEDIDFNRIGFNSNDAPQVVPFRHKEKKYTTLQIIVRNDALNEGFGVFGIIKRWTTGANLKYVK